MLCILTYITLYENPQLAGHSSHNSPLSLAQVIAQDRIRHANAAYQLYYSEMTSADVREQHGWRDTLAERVTRATHNTGMIARFLGKPTKIFGKTFETLTK